MWSPTHVQITVHQARNLKIKGKGGLNDSYVTIQLGREKYQTSIKERIRDPVWNEECDLSMSEQSKNVKLCVFHRNLLGLDEFLGEVSIPLTEIQLHARSSSQWYQLRGKSGSKKPEKDRGELEVTAAFLVQNTTTSQLSLNVDSNKTKKSMSFKNLTRSVGEKLRFSSRSSLNKYDSKADLDSSGVYSSQNVSQRSLTDDVSDGSAVPPEDIQSARVASSLSSSVHELYECGPASSVVSGNSPQVNRSATLGRVKTARGSASHMLPEHWSQAHPRPTRGKAGKSSTFSYATGHGMATKMATYELHEIEEYKRERQKQDLANNDMELTHQLRTYDQEDLVRLVSEQRTQLKIKDTYIHDLEDYIDNLLLKVIETHPKLLQNPYVKTNGDNGNRIANQTTLCDVSAGGGLPRSVTLSPGIYVTNSQNRDNSSTAPSLLTEIVTRDTKSVKSRRRSVNGNPLKFIQSLINSK